MDIIDVKFESFSTIVFEINWLVLISLFILVAIISKVIKYIINYSRKQSINIDEIELGIGNSHITMKYDAKDKEIAYKLWIELNTRKIGLQYDEEDDVLVEIYDSWYKFFEIARELLKEMPQSKFASTPQLIELSLKILNIGLRPHLTKWQAKYRKWYAIEIEKQENADKTPQEIQKKYLHYVELVNDLKITNQRMMEYKELLYEIAFGKR
jgi:hypothetical protein